MPSAPIAATEHPSNLRPACNGLPLAGLSALPKPLGYVNNGQSASAADAAATEGGLASPCAVLAKQQHLPSANRAGSLQAPSEWSFVRRQPYGLHGRRSYERAQGDVATALAEQQQRRSRRRDAKPAAKQQAHAKQLADAADRRQDKLRNRELSGVRLQQAAAAATAAHDAVSAAVAEVCQQQTAGQPVASSSTSQAGTPPVAFKSAAPQQLAQPPVQPSTPPQPGEMTAQPAAPHATHQQAHQPSLNDQPPAAAAEALPAQAHVLQTKQEGVQGPQAPPQPQTPPQQPAPGGLSFMVSDADDWALRERSGQLATPQNSLPLCLQWMDALGSGSIPLLVPVTPSAAGAAAPADTPAAAPPLPPAPDTGAGSAAATGPPDVGEPPKLRSLRLRARRRARPPSFPVTPAGPQDADDPDALSFGGSGSRCRLNRSVSNGSASSVSCRRSGSSCDFSSTPSVSPFAAYSDTPFEEED